jgi:hypothetical protein
MQPNNYLKIFLILLLVNFLGACSLISPKEKVVIQTQYIERNIPIQQRPRPIELYNIKFHVVNQNNLEDFLGRIKESQGDIVFIAVSVLDYESLALNMAELRRYIEQQKSLIIYYEEQLKPISRDENE